MLCILDGWGLGKSSRHNAVLRGYTPVWDRLRRDWPQTELVASGLAVGLPEGQMGNSEVGHLNIGSGRVVYQDLTRINKSIEDGDFFDNEVLNAGMERARQEGASLHLLGLISDGGVHSHLDQILAMVRLARQTGVRRLFVHALLDGRDVPPSSALGYLAILEEGLDEIGLGKVATVSGRYYTMDRDRHWDRVEKGYRAMVHGEGHPAFSATQAVQAAYQRGETDEFVVPTVIHQGDQPVGRIRDGDTLIFCNFRADRAREITRVFVEPDFAEFPTAPVRVDYIGLTEYEASLGARVAFPPMALRDTLGEILSRRGLRQLRIAETEKYAHVTFFFNGGEDRPSEGEDRLLIPSPPVATYDLQPEMSAREVTDRVEEAIGYGSYDVIILNYANPDMVGHTGDLAAAIRAVETVDGCLGRVVEAVRRAGGTLLVTADHGNCEKMVDEETGKPHTAHTSNPVPFLLVGERAAGLRLRTGGSLQDIAPTLLELMGIEQSPEMTGRSLIEKDG